MKQKNQERWAGNKKKRGGMWKQGDELSSEEGSKRGEWKRDIWNGKKYLRGKNYARERWIHLIQNINIKKLFHFDFNLGSFFIKID